MLVDCKRRYDACHTHDFKTHSLRKDSVAKGAGHLTVTASLAKWLRRPPRKRKVRSSNPACDGIFFGSSHTSDLKIGTPVAAPPGAWRYSVSAGTGRTGVSILWLGEVESFICNFYLSVAARTIVWVDPSLKCTSMCLDVKQSTSKQTNILLSVEANWN